ncbi:MAG: DUF2784 domain-containing protein [Gammaproteobacteria bacterium]|nr:DUF2784 domain-containing protein [Gammaproteobacteria bacterium]
MLAKLIADLLVILHLLFILFVLLGGLLVLQWRKMALLHLPCVAWGALVEFSGWICPLTPLENHFRSAAGEQGYQGGFIDHYLMPVIYPAGLDRDTQFVLGLIVIGINLIIYAVILFSRPTPPSKHP